MTPEQLKKVCVYLAFGLIVALAWIVFDCQGDKEIDLSKNAKISRLEQNDRENARLQAENDSIRASERHAREEGYKSAAKANELYQAERTKRQANLKELQVLRAAAGIVPDTITVEIESKYEDQAAADSLQIVRLETRMLADSISFEQEIAAWVTKFDSEVKVSEAWRLQAIESTKDAQKYKRQRNKARTVAAVLGGLVTIWLVDKIRD